MPQLGSRNDLPSNAKALSIAVLNARLVDAIDLALLTKRAGISRGSVLLRFTRCWMAFEANSTNT